MNTFNFAILSDDDLALAHTILGSLKRIGNPDLVIAPDGNPYLYRWHVVPKNPCGNVYFHVQVADDPIRPPHDHPWDNQSVILAGGYIETAFERQIGRLRSIQTAEHIRVPGDVIQRKSTDAHHLRLLPDLAYSMSLFTTGPHLRKWGFYYPDGWRAFDTVTQTQGGVSVHKETTP